MKTKTRQLHEIAITAIIYKNDKVLIIRRSVAKKRFPGMWTVPGGKFEVDDYLKFPKDTESYWYNVLERTLRREVKEEVNLEIKNIEYLTSLAAIHPDGNPSLVISCTADWAGGKVKLEKGELDDYAWVSLKEAKKYNLIEGIYDELIMAGKKKKNKKGKRLEWRRFIKIGFYLLFAFIATSFFLFTSGIKGESLNLFSDGFEDGFDTPDIWTSVIQPKWDTTSGGNTDSYSGEARADIKGNTHDEEEGDSEDDILLKNISTAAYENINLSFWYKIKKSFEEEDHLYIEWTADGQNWNQLDDFTNIVASGSWIQASYDLPQEANNNENFGFRFRAILDAGNDEFYLDDVLLSADEIPQELGNFIVYKYDYDDEELIPGWEICLFKAEYDEEQDIYTAGEVIECKDTIDDEEGQFHGAAVFPFENLEPDTWYIVDEEEKEGWLLDELDFSDIEVDWDYVNEASGQAPVLFDSSFFEGDYDGELYLYNRDITSTLTVYKYYTGEIGQISVAGWQFCIYPEDDEENPFCKETDENGSAVWGNLLPGDYILEEEDRNEWGWWFEYVDGDYDDLLDEESGKVSVEIDEDEEQDYEIYFYNSIYDITPPESAFKASRSYEIIDTEIVSLELTGTSTDSMPIFDEEEEETGSSGIKEAILKIWQLGGSESVDDYPSSVFSNNFSVLSCSSEESETNVLLETNNLNLGRIDPITASWSHSWAPPSSGIYCFEARATDYVGNTEETAFAGPLAYVPVVEIASESIGETLSQTGFTVSWITDKPATSRVIYDTESHSVLDEAPNYGYEFSTPEFDLGEEKTTEHSVEITGLSPETTYYYRTVSAASPESVGDENQVITQPTPTPMPTPSPTPTPPPSGGSGGGGGYVFYHSSSTPTPTPTPTSTPPPAGGPTPTSTPTPTPVLSPSPTKQVTSSPSPVLTQTPVPSKTPEISPEISPETEEPETEKLEEKENYFFALLSSFFNLVDIWWLIILLTVIGLVIYLNRKKKN